MNSDTPERSAKLRGENYEMKIELEAEKQDHVFSFRTAHSVLWSGIGVKIKVAFHCTDLAFYAVLFEFNVASVAFSCSVSN